MDTSPDPNVKRARRNRRSEARTRQRLQLAVEGGKEHPERWRERLGETAITRPHGPFLWIHVPRESAAFPYIALMERLRLENVDLRFLITTTRYTPNDLIRDQLPEYCQLQFLPYDDLPGVKRFLDHWRPDCCLWGETALKPAFIEQISARKIPIFMVDAHLPDEKQHRLRWFPRNTRRMLEKFEHIIAVDGRTAFNLRRLGGAREQIEVLGRLEEAAPALDFVQSDRDALADIFASRPIWLAAGITRNEDSMVLATHKQILHRLHRLLLILVPDDLTHGAKIAHDLEQADWLVCRRAAGQDAEPDTQILIADLPCELGLWLRLSPVTFLGGSMDANCGSSFDPFRATTLGSAVLHGPNTGGFKGAYDRLDKAGAAIEISDEAALTGELEMLLSPDKAAEMARAAWEVSTSGAQVSDRICTLVMNALDMRGL